MFLEFPPHLKSLKRRAFLLLYIRTTIVVVYLLWSPEMSADFDGGFVSYDPIVLVSGSCFGMCGSQAVISFIVCFFFLLLVSVLQLNKMKSSTRNMFLWERPYIFLYPNILYVLRAFFNSTL